MKQLFAPRQWQEKTRGYSKVHPERRHVLTSEVVYSVSGAGEYALSDRDVLGFGGTSGYDSTLNGKCWIAIARRHRLVGRLGTGKVENNQINRVSRLVGSLALWPLGRVCRPDSVHLGSLPRSDLHHL